MHLLKRTAILALCHLICFGNIVGQDSPLVTDTNSHAKPSPSLNALLITDLCANLKGGVNTGYSYLSKATLSASLPLGSWRRSSAEFYVAAEATVGNSFSERLIGDFQIASNIEAGNRIYLHELWYKQTWSRAELMFGQLDMNAEMVAGELNGPYLNSSFGIPSVLSDNVPVPIFPITALGVKFHWLLKPQFHLFGAVFEGYPGDEISNPHNFYWQLNKEEGALGILELHWLPTLMNLPSAFKIGAYYHTGLSLPNEFGGFDTIFEYNYGMYALADQIIWQKESESKHVGVFGQLAISPKRINEHNLYIGLGFNFAGLIDGRPDDILGLGMAHASFHNSVNPHETAIELFYKMNVTSRLHLQPDVQYIIHPSGRDTSLPNALVGILRLSLEL